MVHVVIIGAGVIGLSTAISIREKGYDVTLLAQYLPGDPKNIGYTSPWAGAHHVSSAGNNETQRKLDRETFDVMWKLSGGGDAQHCFHRVRQYEYYLDESGYEALAHMPNFRRLGPTELRPGCTSGITFSTLTINTSLYLPYLLSRLRRIGGKVQRCIIQHINQVSEGAFTDGVSPDALVVCAGLGARSLGGVEDQNVFAIRGQTVLLKAPWVDVGLSKNEPDGKWTYIMPHRNGNVVVGGSAQPHDWYPHCRPEVTRDILERANSLCPELATPLLRGTSRAPSADDLYPLIVDMGCGMRPGRQGGVRLEGSFLDIKDLPAKIPLIYNYGYAGFGYQASWGSANTVVDLLQDMLPKCVERAKL